VVAGEGGGGYSWPIWLPKKRGWEKKGDFSGLGFHPLWILGRKKDSIEFGGDFLEIFFAAPRRRLNHQRGGMCA